MQNVSVVLINETLSPLVQDEFPLMRSKAIVRPIIVRIATASREDCVINDTRHQSLSLDVSDCSAFSTGKRMNERMNK